jgi:hypothetical protein
MAKPKPDQPKNTFKDFTQNLREAEAWIRSNATRELTKDQYVDLMQDLVNRGIVNPEPEYPQELERSDEELDKVLGAWLRTFWGWADEMKRALWKHHKVLPVSEDKYQFDRDVPQWVLEHTFLEWKDVLPENEANLFDIYRAMSMKPAQTVDRAARGPKGWRYPKDEPPRYEDPRNAHIVEYYTEGVPLQALRESIEKLNPRSADVWRLVTAASLEAWQDGQLEPPSVWIDVRQLCGAMGYKKATHGGYKPEHVAEAARALKDLKSFRITIPLGERTYPEDPKTGKRKASRLEARRTYEVLMVPATDEVRNLFTSETLPMRWLIRPGEWIKGYPKQFAPLYRALVELPAKGVNVWAKAIGTELSWQYRQNGGEAKTLRVRTLLEQTDLLADLLDESRNRGRARNNLENALDVLQREGVCKSWEYHPEDIDAVEREGRRGWFDVWLEARITVAPPDQITGALSSVKKRALESKKRAQHKISKAKAKG